MAALDASDALTPARGRRALFTRVGDAIARGCTALAAAALGVIVLINGANVVGRYFFNRPVAWAEEGMLYLMVLTVFAGSCAVTWRRQHIRIEVLTERLPRGGQLAALGVVTIVSVLALVAAAWGSYLAVSMLHMFDQRSDALEIPIWIPQGLVTLGLLLNALLFIARLVLDYRAPAAPGHSPSHGAHP